MDKKRLTIFAISVGILILVVVLLLVRGTARRSGHIQLPDASTGTGEGQTGQDGEEEALHVVAVRPDTVQLAIEVMERPGVYTQRLTVETFWDGGSGTESSPGESHHVSIDITGNAEADNGSPVRYFSNRLISRLQVNRIDFGREGKIRFIHHLIGLNPISGMRNERPDVTFPEFNRGK